MSTERDSHFQGFAKTLWDELMAVTDGYIDVSSDGMDNEWIEQYKVIIARRAYDLVEHALENQPIIPHIASGIVLSNEEIMKEVPDLTEWPE